MTKIDTCRTMSSCKCHSQVDITVKQQSFRDALRDLINCHCQENDSDTPDFILADYLINCLESFNKATRKRTSMLGI